MSGQFKSEESLIVVHFSQGECLFVEGHIQSFTKLRVLSRTGQVLGISKINVLVLYYDVDEHKGYDNQDYNFANTCKVQSFPIASRLASVTIII